MDCAVLLTALNVIIASIGVLFVALAVFEYTKLKGLRKSLHIFKDDWYRALAKLQKAQQRVIASYSVKDIDQRITLLQSAVAEDPKTFNGYNTLGYAYLEKGDRMAAADAFKEAINQHPEMKEGYCDLARCYLGMGKTKLCREYLDKAVKVDPTSKDDIEADEQLSVVWKTGRLG